MNLLCFHVKEVYDRWCKKRVPSNVLRVKIYSRRHCALEEREYSNVASKHELKNCIFKKVSKDNPLTIELYIYRISGIVLISFDLRRKINSGKDSAAKHAQKRKGIEGEIFAKLFPIGGARKAPAMPIELTRPSAVPP